MPQLDELAVESPRRRVEVFDAAVRRIIRRFSAHFAVQSRIFFAPLVGIADATADIAAQ